MKIAIITDIHDNIWNLEKAIKKINYNHEVELVINCGDICSPFIIKQLGDLEKKQLIVFSDRDLTPSILNKCKEKGIKFFKDFGELEIDGKKIGFTHKERLAKRLKGFDVIFYGHLHQYKVGKANDNTLLVCCGEIMGRKINPCFTLYDTETEEVKKIELG